MVGEIAEAVKVALEILMSHIEDPKRRLRAVQDYRDELRKYLEQIKDEENMAKVDSIITDFITAIHRL